MTRNTLSLPARALACVALALSTAPAFAAARRVTVMLPSAADLVAEDAARDEAGLPWRFAVPQGVRATPAVHGRWETLPDGSRRWTLEVASPGAVSLNLGFVVYWLPAGATLTVRATDGSAPALVFDAGDNADHGELWTPALPVDSLVVELAVPAGVRLEPLLELGTVNCGYRPLGAAPEAKAGSCNVDVVCPEGDAWRAEIAAVGLLSVEGSYICTGAMVNNSGYDGRPYFLTANHCNITDVRAPSVVVYWNFASPTCGLHGGGSLAQFTSGSLLRATWSSSDFTLLELDELPDPAYGVTYAGWNRGATLPTSATAIHHPSSDEKSISFETAALRETGYTGVTEPGDGTHLRVVDWDTGTTEPGSSGSPLFDQNHLLVGQLHGGWAACGNDLSDWYGWLRSSWDGGGAAATRLADWLDPGATGALTLPLFDPAAGEFAVAPAGDAEGSGLEGGPFTPGSWVYTLANAGASPAAFTAAIDRDWATVTPASGAVAAGAQVDVTVTLASAATDLGAGRHTATLTLANPGRGTSETRAVALEVVGGGVTVLGAGPNPFGDEVAVRLNLPAAGTVIWRVYDLRGCQVLGARELAGTAGENAVIWDGRDGSGRPVPSGSYVILVAGLGREFRVPVVCGR